MAPPAKLPCSCSRSTVTAEPGATMIAGCPGVDGFHRDRVQQAINADAVRLIHADPDRDLAGGVNDDGGLAP